MVKDDWIYGSGCKKTLACVAGADHGAVVLIFFFPFLFLKPLQPCKDGALMVLMILSEPLNQHYAVPTRNPELNEPSP